MPKKLDEILWILKADNIDFELEYLFHPIRKWRFDVALWRYKIAIEYEGVVSNVSRHTNNKGYTNDCQKYNQANIHGWIVLRYTALSKHSIRDEIHQAIKQRIKENGKENEQA